MPSVSPAVTWAQRSAAADPDHVYYNKVIVTITAPNVPDDKYSLSVVDNKISFRGTSPTTTYLFELELYETVKGEDSKVKHSGDTFELIIPKRDDSNVDYWPRLAKQSGKLHNVSTDFDKWVDEDEQNEEPEQSSAGFGGMPGGGMPGMDFGAGGGMPGMPGMNFGGAGGMPGMPGMNFGDMGNFDMSSLGGLGGLGGAGDDDEELSGDEEADESGDAPPLVDADVTETTKEAPVVELAGSDVPVEKA